jgi:hypothetical protein
VEHVGVLTRAVRRLDAAAAELEPLGVAERGLAALTRVRLGRLTAPGSGDEALAAALDRGAQPGVVEAEVEPPSLRRLAAPPVVAEPGRALPAAAVPQRGRTAVAPTAATAAGANLRPAPPAPVAVRRLGAGAAGETRRRTFDAFGADAPIPPPRSIGADAGVTGLEWVAPRVPGGAGPAETPVVDGVPDAASPSRWAGAPDRTTQGRGVPAPAEPARTIPSVESERLPDAEDARAWPAPATTESRPRSGANRHGLEALVRSWREPATTEPEHAAPSVFPAETGDTATSTSMPTPRPRPPDRTSEREDETLAFGDALGRLLVAELRRYGIEVDAA